MRRLTGRRYFNARVEIDNHALQELMKKLGATQNGISELLLHGEEIERFQEENKKNITDEIRECAAEFCMDAKDIWDYVLQYRFDVEKEQAANVEKLKMKILDLQDLGKEEKQDRCFCVACEYYEMCKVDG